MSMQGMQMQNRLCSKKNNTKHMYSPGQPEVVSGEQVPQKY